MFKIQTDPFIGRLAYVRIYSGVMQTGQMLQNSTSDRKERIGRLVKVYAEKRDEVTELRAGDIGAIVERQADLHRRDTCATRPRRSCWKPSTSPIR